MNHMLTDTAHLYWNAEWQKADGSSPWAMPEPWAIDHASTLALGSRILDLGAGIGRHALAFAEAGHEVTALDASEAATAAVRLAPQSAAAWTELGRFRFNAGDVVGAIEASAKAVVACC